VGEGRARGGGGGGGGGGRGGGGGGGEGWFVTSFNIYIHEVKNFASQIMFPLLQLRKFYFGKKFRAKNKKSADICYLYINDLQQKSRWQRQWRRKWCRCRGRIRPGISKMWILDDVNGCLDPNRLKTL
jgi:hypothetical protein